MGKKVQRIGIVTGGGDCPGLNAIIRAATKLAINHYRLEVFGVEDGFEGLVEDRIRPLTWESTSGIMTAGGTILGANNKANPFSYPVLLDDKREMRDVSQRCLEVAERRGLDGLVVAGGDGTMTICRKMAERGLPIIGVPKTIDNDLHGTDWTVGFDTAVGTATFAIDKLHSTAQSHHRIMVVEVMGRYAGWLALESASAGGADVVLIPEIPYDLELVCEHVRDRGRRSRGFSIVVVAEGAKPKGGDMVVARRIEDSPEQVRLGGIGAVIAHQLELCSRLEARHTTLGHLQRGGTPSPFDRNLATLLAFEAVHRLVAGKTNILVGMRGRAVVPVPLKDTEGTRTVPLDHPLVTGLKDMGICLGCE